MNENNHNDPNRKRKEPGMEPEPHSTPIKVQSHADVRTGLQNIPETNVILPSRTTNTKDKETIIDIEPTKVTSDVKYVQGKDILVYMQQNPQNMYGQPNQQNMFGQQHQQDTFGQQKQSMFGQTNQGMYNNPNNPTTVNFEVESPFDSGSRSDFVQKVFILLLAMLIVTAAFVTIVLITDDLKEFFQYYGAFLALPAMLVMMGLCYAMALSPCSRVFPCNIVMLVLSVICMSIICAFITSRYKTQIVLLALLATCVVVAICVALAFSGFDFTSWMLYIVVIAAAFGAIALVVGLGMLCFGVYIQGLHLGILIVGTLINVVVLAMELQMVLGGGAVELGEEDYALGAFMLYTSIVDIFLKLVQILGILEDCL